MNPFFQKGGFIMSNKKSKLGVISAVAAGTGTAIYLAQKAKKESGNSESGNSIFKKSTVADSSVPEKCLHRRKRTCLSGSGMFPCP